MVILYRAGSVQSVSEDARRGRRIAPAFTLGRATIDVTVTIPTRNRPEKLQRCLSALGEARRTMPFRVLVADSSDREETRTAVASVCAGFEFVAVRTHTGTTVAAARNFCAREAETEVIVSLDDDVYVEPDAVAALVGAYRAADGPRVVAGTVAWGNRWSKPVVMRWIGYGREPRPGEQPSFLISAFIAYSRQVALSVPWNERMRPGEQLEDVFMGAAWRAAGVKMLYEPRARARHDDEHTDRDEFETRIYVNLFDALIANPNPARALSYELLGFAAGAKKYLRIPETRSPFLVGWWRGHRALARDWRYLKTLADTSLPLDDQ